VVSPKIDLASSCLVLGGSIDESISMNEGVRRLLMVLGGILAIGWVVILAIGTNGFSAKKIDIEQAYTSIVYGGVIAYSIPWVVAKVFFWIREGFQK